MKLHLFNPENDLALADGNANYCAPPAAERIAYDLATLPLWYASSSDAVWLPDKMHIEYCRRISSLFDVALPFGQHMIERVSSAVPWGWSPQVVRRYMQAGVPVSCLPAKESVEKMRMLSNRQSSIRILSRLAASGISIPPLPKYIDRLEDVADYVCGRERCVVKAPWSGSGKGIMWGIGRMEVPMEHFCKGVIKRQGAVLCEEYLSSVREFAMEFLAKDGRVQFAGYSLFNTEKGSYSGNVLASDGAIESLLAGYIQLDLIRKVRNSLPPILEEMLAGCGYEGYLGIDMMIYDDNGTCCLNPCMELNLRMNMGMVSRIFFDRFVEEGRRGEYFVSFCRNEGEAYCRHCINKERYPLKTVSSRIASGYIELSPVDRQSRYAAYAIIY